VPRRPDARFLFLVHPLTEFHRRVIAARTASWRLLTGRSDGLDPGEVAPLCRISHEQGGRRVEGVVLSVPMLPAQILENQEAALRGMRAAVAAAGGGVDAVGLGSLLAVAAGRGSALQERIWQPVTTGGAATAWAASENALSLAKGLGLRPADPMAVLGFGGAVGAAIVERLRARGAQRLQVEAVGPHLRKAERLGLEGHPDARSAVRGCRVIVGASSAGGILRCADLDPGSLLLDVALPPTLLDASNASQRGIEILAGEALALPPGYGRGGWGHLYHLLAGYGPSHLFACVVEPLVMAFEGRSTPFAQGRRIDLASVDALGEGATRAGFRPVLLRRWREVEASALA
jgi:predicted amino acid dehydrogenase